MSTPDQNSVSTPAAINRLYDAKMYDQIVEEYYDHSGFLNFGYWNHETANAKEASEKLMAKLLDLQPDKEGTILDVACGKGATSKFLLNYYEPHQITGINISKKQLDSCRNLVPDARFLLMDAVDLQFPADSFDTLICVEAAFHFKTRQQFFGESYKILKPGGCLILSDALISGRNKENRPHLPPENFIDNLDQYKSLLSQAGFQKVSVFDTTQECFHGGFWSVVRFIHGKFLDGAISAEHLQAFLDRVYRLTADLEYYVLAVASKPSGAGQTVQEG